MLLAKESLMDDLDMYELQARAAAEAEQVEGSCAWSCLKRSTPWASARKAWAA